ncbi:mitochondrial DNA-3-methyladenine glycosylase [Andalucia godoyi]|uniref:DNA-3-methyladenine glycosylase II n=1 Tax=Andalucia godoyi TaxID=505711 RepID=A0A8K0AIE4_ANDGO|nr:mitochondrial DNA-3-methyladenine glycosylase [Andalucia godoyi]|eukprot:ANDGO_06747.mRNA.1 mitochondrial DNA-3-methyladenine glycosylase
MLCGLLRGCREFRRVGTAGSDWFSGLGKSGFWGLRMAGKMTKRYPLVPLEYFERSDAISCAKGLLGKLLVTRSHRRGQGHDATQEELKEKKDEDEEWVYTSGVIVETEAYAGVNDRGSHVFGDRKTQRTAPLYESGGCVYVYKCYGIHWLLNISAGPKSTPYCVLIRAIQPVEGTTEMMRRSMLASKKKSLLSPTMPNGGDGGGGGDELLMVLQAQYKALKRPLGCGPGLVTTALGIDGSFNFAFLDPASSNIWIEDAGSTFVTSIAPMRAHTRIHEPAEKLEAATVVGMGDVEEETQPSRKRPRRQQGASDGQVAVGKRFGAQLRGPGRMSLSDCQSFQIIESPRVGIEYAGADKHHWWRFRIAGNTHTSPAP